MRSSGEAAAVLAAALVWLGLLTFPVGVVLSAAPTPRRWVALAALLVLVLVYVAVVVRVARRGAPARAPVAVAVVATVAVLLPLAGSAWIGGTIFLAALLGLTLSLRRALVGIAVATGVAVLQAVVGNPAPAQALSVPLLTAVAGVVVVVVVREVAVSRELAASRQAIATATAREERLRLARELHDSVKQQAFVAALELSSARARLGADPHLDAAAEAVGACQRQLGEVLDHIRPVDQPALASALRRHVEQWSRRNGVPAEVAVEADRDVPAEPLLTVASEALTNVARHSDARNVRLVLGVDGGRARLTVIDDGHGFDLAVTAPGQGLRGMAERLAECRGGLEIRSGEDGTTLVADYPDPS